MSSGRYWTQMLHRKITLFIQYRVIHLLLPFKQQLLYINDTYDPHTALHSLSTHICGPIQAGLFEQYHMDIFIMYAHT